MDEKLLNHDEHYARYSYESLILQQPNIPFDGLWTDGSYYYAVCPILNDNPVTEDGEPLVTWFDTSCRVVTSPVTIVNKPPVSSVKVPERTVEELSQLHGEPLTVSDLYRELISALPKDFPDFEFSAEFGKVIFFVKYPLSQDQENTLNIACTNLKIGLLVEIHIAQNGFQENSLRKVPVKGPDVLSLMSSEGLSSASSKLVKEKYEEDEEFWTDKRIDIFSSEMLDSNQILPHSFTDKTSSCFIDATVFVPKNIRTYLTLYRRTIIAMPLSDSLDSALQGLMVSREDLVELVRRKRVQFVLPQSIERYSIDFISALLEANPSSLVFSRRLAAASIAATRKRLPILYPPFGSGERRIILELFASVENTKFGYASKVIREHLGTTWIGMERNLSARGAMGTANHGIGPILGELYHSQTGRDARLELISSSMSVEWAAALNSTYFPIESSGYSDAAAAQLCASVYSGVKNQAIINPIKNLDILVNGLLALDNDASVLEIDEVFANNDIDQLGQLVSNIKADEDIAGILQSINEKVRRFETNQNRLNRLDILGLGGAAAAALSGNVYIPLGIWLAQYVLKNADASRDVGGKVIDWMRAKNARTTSDAVLISRLRGKQQRK